MTARRATLALLLMGAVVTAAETLHASDISGKVVLSGKPAAEAVVSIEGLTVTKPQDTTTIYVVDHRNLDFIPHVLVIRRGSKVRFENSDRMPCHIYSISPAGTFALRAHDGELATMTFDQPGVIVVRCADHARIYAYIIVRENPFYAITDRRGRYKLSGFPPGHYTLQAWYEGNVIGARDVQITGKQLKADFRAERPQPRVENAVPASVVAAFAPRDASTPIVSWRKEQ